MKVMIAIRISGTFAPPISSANTSDGSGHGTVVDIRTVMYEIRKQLKMKVSLSRKIHIMAFPQDALLKARWSEDQSATRDRQPPGCVTVSCVSAGAISGIGLILTEGGAAQRDEPGDGRRVGQQGEQADPGQQQEVPIGGAKFDAGAQLRYAGPGLQP